MNQHNDQSDKARSNQTARKSRIKSCLVVAGITVVVLMVALVGFIWFGVYSYQNTISDAPSVRPYNPSRTQKKQLQEKIEHLNRTAKRKTAPDRISISEGQINALIAGSKKQISDRLRIQLRDNQILAKVSIPADKQDRKWLNGEIKVNCEITADNRLKIEVTDVTIEKDTVAAKVMKKAFKSTRKRINQRVQKELERAYEKDPVFRRLTKRLRDIQVEENALILLFGETSAVPRNQ